MVLPHELIYGSLVVGLVVAVAIIGTDGKQLSGIKNLLTGEDKLARFQRVYLPGYPAVLTRTSRGLRTVRTGYAYRPPACCTYRRLRAACPWGRLMHLPASGVPHVPRTVAPHRFLLAMLADWLQGPFVYALYQGYGIDREHN
eukprot:scaffold94046_cov54-Phaeocystis_antarctica.AAC.1